jgi:hypothetical protein
MVNPPQRPLAERSPILSDTPLVLFCSWPDGQTVSRAGEALANAWGQLKVPHRRSDWDIEKGAAGLVPHGDAVPRLSEAGFLGSYPMSNKRSVAFGFHLG